MLPKVCGFQLYSAGPKIGCVLYTLDMHAFWVHILWKNWHFVGLGLPESDHFNYSIGVYFLITKVTWSYAIDLEKFSKIGRPFEKS